MNDADLARVLTGAPPERPDPHFDGPQQGRITKTAGGVFFTIPDWSDVREFGPARVTGATPAVGDVVLVVFIGGNVERPWVITGGAPV